MWAGFSTLPTATEELAPTALGFSSGAGHAATRVLGRFGQEYVQPAQITSHRRHPATAAQTPIGTRYQPGDWSLARQYPSAHTFAMTKATYCFTRPSPRTSR